MDQDSMTKPHESGKYAQAERKNGSQVVHVETMGDKVAANTASGAAVGAVIGLIWPGIGSIVGAAAGGIVGAAAAVTRFAKAEED